VLDPEMGAADPVGWLRGEWENMGAGEKIGALAPLPSPAKATAAMKMLETMGAGGAVAGIAKSEAMKQIKDVFWHIVPSSVPYKRVAEVKESVLAGADSLAESLWKTVRKIDYSRDVPGEYAINTGEIFFDPMKTIESTIPGWAYRLFPHEVTHGVQWYPAAAGISKEGQAGFGLMQRYRGHLYDIAKDIGWGREPLSRWEMLPGELQATAIGELSKLKGWPRTAKGQLEILEDTIWPAARDAAKNIEVLNPEMYRRLRFRVS
jgi:hypothetical protein